MILTMMLQSKMLLALTVMVTVMIVSGAVEVNTAKVVDGGWTKFNKTGEVGPCRCVSGSGFMERIWRRTCTKPKPRRGGKKCKGRRKVVRIENCDSSICNIKEEVAWGEWSAFGRCSTSCGPGIRSRWRYWNEFDPVKKKTNTENILCHNPHCPISFSLQGENYQLISRLQGYKWDIGPGWGFVCNDEAVVGDLLEAVEAVFAVKAMETVEAGEGNSRSNLAMQLIEGTAMFVKQAPANSGEEAWQYIEVDDPEEEVEILNWEFVPIDNSNIVDYQKQMCHLLSSPEEAEKMNRGLLKIFRKKSFSAEPLSGNITSSNSKFVKSLHGVLGSVEDEPFRARNVKNYRIPSRDLNRMSSRKPFNWREKGLDPDLQPPEPRLLERIRMSSFPDNNEEIGSSPDDDCQCINGTALFLASHRLMERGFGVVSGKTKCQCAQSQERPEKISAQQYNGSQTSSHAVSNNVDRPSSSVGVTTPGYLEDQTSSSHEDHILPPSIANATELYSMEEPHSDGDGYIKSPITSNGDGSEHFPHISNDSQLHKSNGDSSAHITDIPNDSHVYISNYDGSAHNTPNNPHLYSSNSPPTSTAHTIQASTTVAATVEPSTCPPTETIMERCVWLTSITKQEESFHQWDQDGDGLLTAEEWMYGRKGKDCISGTAMKYYVEEAIKTIKRFNGDGIKTKATFLEFYAINRGTSHAFDC